VGKSRKEYIYALKYKWLTPLYDPVLRLTLREQTFKKALVEQARIQPGQRVLDLGCGTGTLTLLIKSAHPHARVVGFDGDPKILALAEAKAARAGLAVDWKQGLAQELPYADGCFDRVLTSLMLHHLSSENKRAALREVLRVLRPGGELHVADWGRPQNALMRPASLLIALLDGYSRENVAGLLLELFRQAGLVEARQAAHYNTLFGTLALYSARKPA